MTSNRRLNNPLALAVLVHLYEKPRHPYELSTTMKERRKEQSIRLNYGSLYTVVEALARDKYIRAIETTREGKRPERTVYEIMPEGITLMLEWMRELVSVPIKEYPQFEAALSLLPVLPPEEVVMLLESRIQALKKNLAECAKDSQQTAKMGLPRLFSIEGEYYEAMTKAECKFTEVLLKDIQNDTGQFTTIWTQLRASVLGSKTRSRNKTKTPSK